MPALTVDEMDRKGSRQAPRQPLAAEAERLLAQLAEPGERVVVSVLGQRIELSNLDKPFWPKLGRRGALAKRDLLVYLAGVAAYLLPHLRDRPLTLKRYPNGVGGKHFFQQHWQQARPEFVETVGVFSEHRGGDAEHVVCNNLPTLIWLGQIADLELHTWYSRISPGPDGHDLAVTFDGSVERLVASRLNYPDFVVFDLDPYFYSGKGRPGAGPELRKGFAQARAAALRLKQLLDGLSLVSFVKTSGQSGLHVYLPIARRLDYETVYTVGKAIAARLVQQHPDEVTIEWSVGKRGGKLFLDYNQNVRGKTLASPYSPRALPEATVSMPLRWDELDAVSPTDFTLITAPERLRRVGDLWADILAAKQDLGGLTGAAPA